MPHHASKHGLNLSLVEAVGPSLSLVSSVGGGGKYNFPHTVTLEALREGLESTTKEGKAHSPDHELGIHYTSARDPRGALGSIALIVSPTGRKRDLWRFRDGPDDDVSLARACRFVLLAAEVGQHREHAAVVLGARPAGGASGRCS